MAKIKLTKNELKVQKDALKMYKRYLPTLMLKKQQLQTEIRTIDAKAKEVRAQRVALEKEFEQWISVFGEREAFTPDMVTVKNIKKGTGNIAGVTIPVYAANGMITLLPHIDNCEGFFICRMERDRKED